jgi:hypothetical protein
MKQNIITRTIAVAFTIATTATTSTGAGAQGVAIGDKASRMFWECSVCRQQA